MTAQLSVSIRGKPAPKGSLWPRQLPGRVCPVCKRSNGRIVLIEDNKGTRLWRKQIRAAAEQLRHAAGGTLPGAICVKVTLTLARPNSRRPRVGAVGCGQCWEAAIRDDARQVS